MPEVWCFPFVERQGWHGELEMTLVVPLQNPMNFAVAWEIDPAPCSALLTFALNISSSRTFAGEGRLPLAC